MKQLLGLDEPFDKGSLLAIFGVALGALMPIFFSTQVGELGVGRILLILTGVTFYLFLTTYVFEWYIKRVRWQTAVLYFGAHLLLFVALEFVMSELGLYFWLLTLPVAGQAISLPRWATVFIIACFMSAIMFVLYFAGVSTFNMWSSFWSILAAMLFVVLFTYVVNRETKTRQKLELLTAELQTANRKLMDYTLQVEELTLTKERNRMAREIHDTLGHYLTVINMQLNAAQAVMATKPEVAQEAIGKAQRLSKEGLAEVRHSVSALREQAGGVERPLPDTLQTLLAEIQTSGINTSLQIEGQPHALSPQVHLTLYRTAQEALTNARKYAQATHIELLLAYKEHETSLHVADNGIGATQTDGGFGLVGLRERVQLLGGSLQYETAPNQGFTLQVDLPI